MSHSLNLTLTDELRAFVDENCGDGTRFATPSEFVRDLLRQRMAQDEAQALRDAIVAGYQDAIAGRVVAYTGDLQAMLKARRKSRGSRT